MQKANEKERRLLEYKDSYSLCFNMVAIQAISRAAVLTLLVLTLSTGCKRSTATNGGASAPASSKLAHDMIGTWVHVGRPGQVREAPTEGGRFKYRTGTHWVVIGVDPDTGL